jgi:hypothetical protein
VVKKTKFVRNNQKFSKSLLKFVPAITCKPFFKKTSRKQRTYEMLLFAFFQRKIRTYINMTYALLLLFAFTFLFRIFYMESETEGRKGFNYLIKKGVLWD